MKHNAESVARYSEDDIIDAGHDLAWVDHDIALLIATLQERESLVSKVRGQMERRSAELTDGWGVTHPTDEDLGIG